MRTNKLFIGALAVLFSGLASCSSEEPAGGNGNDAESKDGNQYMSVVISTAGMDNKGKGRALPEDSEFEEGDGNECVFDAPDIMFLFFDENGNPFPLAAANIDGTTVSNSVIPKNVAEDHGPGNTDRKVARLVLGKAVGSGYIGKKPTQALCLINVKGRIKEEHSELINQSLRTVLTCVATMATNLNADDAKFMMTNSTYKAENGEIVTTMKLDDCFKNTPGEADANPVICYVERVVAKVRVTGLNKDFDVQQRDKETNTASVKDYTVDNKPLKLKVQLVAWKLINTATENYIFKQISDKEYFPDWNDYDKHRCYWTEPLNSTFANQKYDILEETIKDSENNNIPNPNYVKNGEWTDGDTNNVEYCLENTIQPASATDRTSNATGIVVKAVVKADLTEDGVENYEPVTLVRWAGAYYTYNTFRQMVADAYNGSTSSGAAIAYIDNVKIKRNSNDNYCYAYIDMNGTITTMTNFSDLLVWRQGMTSYYVNVEHTPGSTAEKKLYGVVRNHIYHYEFDGVIGLGIPGNSTEVKEETESFLSAQIYCLSWRVVNNKVTLE